MTSAEYRQYLKDNEPKKNKYGTKPMETGGEKFSVTLEGQYYQNLLFKQMLPESDPDRVLKIERQVVFSLDLQGVHICNYKLDFRVTYPGRVDHVDNKGYKKGVPYRLFLVKKALMKIIYGIEIIEISRK